MIKKEDIDVNVTFIIQKGELDIISDRFSYRATIAGNEIMLNDDCIGHIDSKLGTINFSDLFFDKYFDAQ